MHIVWELAVALVALVGIAALAGLVGEVGTVAATTVAAVRAVVQLGVVALVILAVVRAWWSTALFILVMVGVATWTSARRLTPHRSGLVAGAAILAGAVPVVVVVLASGTISFTGIAVVPIAGIIIGGAMSATSLAGRRALDTLATRRGEYEAALSLGLVERDAALLLLRTSAAEALVPRSIRPGRSGSSHSRVHSSEFSSGAVAPSQPGRHSFSCWSASLLRRRSPLLSRSNWSRTA
jgi:putative ABC transport system permease protein